MVVIRKTILDAFGKTHPNIADAPAGWYTTFCQADWQSLADIRQTVNSVDYIKNERYGFTIKGSPYRLGAMIFFDKRTLFIRFIGSHQEYDTIDRTTI